MKTQATLLICCAAALLVNSSAHATTYYWNTTTSPWASAANWSDNATSGGITGVIPLSTDRVVFNQSSVNAAEIIQLNAATSIAGMTFNNTGTTLVESSSATSQAITIGASGITVNSGAGAVTIGSTSNPSPITLGANQNWITASGTTLTVVGNIANPGINGTYWLQVQGAGTTVLSNGSATLHILKDGGFVENGGTLTLDHYNFTTSVDDNRGAVGIGTFSANNTFNVGAGSSFPGGSSATYFRIGTAGNGNNKLYVSNGGTFITPYRWDLGNNASNVAQVDGDGSTMTLSGNQNNATGGTIKATNGGLAYWGCINGKVSSTLNLQANGTDPTTGAAAVMNVGSYLYLNIAAGNTASITNGGLMEFASATPTMGFYSTTGGSLVTINGGGLSYKNVTSGLDISANKTATANTVGAFTWSGNNALRLNGSTDSTATTAYTFANNLGSTNYTSLQLYGTASITRAIIIDGTHGGTLLLKDATATISGGVTLIDPATVTARGTASTLNAAITGGGSLVKAGAGTLTLASGNTYSGDTTVSEGVLRLNSPNSSNETTAVTICSGAKLDLNFDESGGPVTDTVDKLFIGTTQMQAGVYGATGSGADLDHTDDTHFAGSGTLTVTTSTSPTPYLTWSGGVSFTADANGDGVANGLAWCLGATSPTANGRAVLPTVGTAPGFLTMHFLRVHNMGPAKLYLEYSNDLNHLDPWHVVDLIAGPLGDIVLDVVTGSPNDEVTVKIPTSHAAASGRLFSRLHATEN
jgi:autotransporter-associated beta strand protein